MSGRVAGWFAQALRVSLVGEHDGPITGWVVRVAPPCNDGIRLGRVEAVLLFGQDEVDRMDAAWREAARKVAP